MNHEHTEIKTMLISCCYEYWSDKNLQLYSTHEMEENTILLSNSTKTW
jgi:hypothetical protein